MSLFRYHGPMHGYSRYGQEDRYGYGNRYALPNSYHGYGSLYRSMMYDYTPYPFTYSYDVPSVRGIQRSMYGRTYGSMSDYGYRNPYGSALFGYKEPKHNILPEEEMAMDYYGSYPRYSRHIY